jgi:adenosine deaminase
MTQYPEAFIRAIPKTDLHVHLDGSLRLPTLIELARERGVALPSETEEGLNELVFKPAYRDLDEYLQGFTWTLRVMQDIESLERTAYELALDNWAEGVRYLEVRFAPQLHMSGDLGFAGVMTAVDRGMRRARDEVNRGLPDGEPPFDYGIIVCAMRFFTGGFSRYYADLCRTLSFSDPVDVIRTASLELARAAVHLRDETDVQIVGFDLAGSEYGYPADDHLEVYEYVHRNFLRKTVHAGEAYGPESIFQAIAKLHADRIGHGLHLFDEDMIRSEAVRDRKAYIKNLVNYIAENRIGDHSLKKMLDQRLSITLCTDNRLVSHTTVTRELKLALAAFDIPPDQLKDIIIYGFKRSFCHLPYPEKRKYVRRVIEYYERLEREHGVVAATP